MIDKETAGIVLSVVVILAVFAIIQPLIPTATERFSELGVLGANKKIGDYPTNVTLGSSASLFVYIGNHEGVVEFYNVKVKLGNQTTIVNNVTSARAPLVASFYRVLSNNQTYVLPLNLSFEHAGTNEKLIIELWMFNTTSGEFQYTGLWNQLFVNVTALPQA